MRPIALLTLMVAIPLLSNAQEFIDVNMDVGGMGVNMNVNVRETNTITTTTTTTTTTTGVRPAPVGQPAAYVMPGYNGPIGCPWPMDNGQFNGVRQSVASKTWDETRLSVASQAIGSSCVTSAQVRELVRLMEWEETKLNLAKFAYSYTYDLGNYYMVNDAFEWEQSITELNAFIRR